MRVSSLFAQGAPEPAAGPARAPTASFESHDRDLAWIIERLVERVGGTFGVMCRYLEFANDAAVVACSAPPDALPDNFLGDICESTRCASHFHDHQAADTPRVSECSSPARGDYPAYRILCLSFYPSPRVNLVAAVLRPHSDAPFEELERSIAAFFYPVLSRYVQLWWMHREERTRAHALKTALDICDFGVLLLDRRLELQFENASARALLKPGGGLRHEGKYITAEAEEDGMALQAALQHAKSFNLLLGAQTQRQRAPLLTLRRTAGKRPLIVTVMGLDRPAMDATDPAVVVYILDPSRDVRELLTPLCNIYKLTATETKLAYLLVAGMSITAAASQMKVREATARSYLKQIFLKTMTNRQADLVRLMLSSLQRVNPGVDLTPINTPI